MAAPKVSGPYDKYRNQRPSNIPQDKWDAYIDEQNASAGGRALNLAGGITGEDQIRNKTPQEFAAEAQDALGVGRSSTPQSVQRAGITSQINDMGLRNEAQNNALRDDYLGAVGVANQTDINAIGSLTSAQDRARAGYQGVATNVRNDANNANAAQAGLWGGLMGGYGQLNAQDQAALGSYLTATDPLMTRTNARGSDPADIARQMGEYNRATGIANGSLDYSAAQYASNPADIARQQQGYNNLLGVGQGSLDYQAAQYYSNPADLQRQMDSYGDLRAAGRGALDYKSQAAEAYASDWDMEQQRKALLDIQDDLAHGSEDQREVMNKYKALSNPEVTAQERFLSELARREFEQADRSSRAAVSENLAMRGLRSGGQQIAMQQAEGQQLAQDRLLKELGIQSQAVGRSMEALGGWGNEANAIRAGDQNALNMQAGLTTALRNASFDEAYKRGIGADNAAANNQATRMRGYEGAANQANNIRSANDTVGMFNTGQTNIAQANNQATRLSGYQGAAAQSNAIRNSNDTVGMFNTGQTNQARANNQATRLGGAQLSAAQSNAIRNANDSQRQFEDSYSQNESIRIGNLAGQRQQATLNTTNNVGNRMQSGYDAGRDLINDSNNRNNDANRAQWDVTDKDYGMSGDYFDAVTDNAQRRVDRTGSAATNVTNINSVNSDALARRLGITNDQWEFARENSLAGL